MTKTNPTWDTAVKDDWTAVDDMTPAEANAHGDAINELLATDSTPGATRCGIDKSKWDIDGEQSVDNLLRNLIAGIRVTKDEAAPVTVTAIAGDQNRPCMIELANGNLVVAYEQIGVVWIACKISTDGGATWGVEKTVYDPADPKVAKEPYLLQLANGDVLCFFQTDEDGDQHIKFMKSTDGGATWGSKTNVYTSDVSDFPSAVQKSNGDVICLFCTEEDGGAVYHLKCLTSDDNGATWGSKTTVYSGGTVAEAWDAILFGDDSIIASFGEGNALKTTQSNDEGGTWETPVTALNTANCRSLHLLKTTLGVVLGFYQHDHSGVNELRCLASLDCAQSWESRYWHIYDITNGERGPGTPVRLSDGSIILCCDHDTGATATDIIIIKHLWVNLVI